MTGRRDTTGRRFTRFARRAESAVLGLLGVELDLPDFLVIGAQKSGTTWLHENLARHPEVFVPPRKELHYFDEGLGGSLRSYAAHFRAAAGRVRGETTPAYSALADPDVALVRKLVPDVAVILILRDPIERAWSQAVMEVATRRGRDPATVADEEYAGFLAGESASVRGDYVGMLDRWERHFPGNAILVNFFDELTTAPEALLNRVFRHLGVAEVDDWSSYPVRKVITPVVDPSALDRAARVGSFAVETSDPDERRRSSETMPEGIRSLLRERYADDVAALRRRFGDALPLWEKR